MEEKDKCENRISTHMTSRLTELRLLWADYTGRLKGKEQKEFEEEFGYKPDGEGTAFYEYGLSFDYVAPGTFNNQRQGYFRYQLSWGGPSEEFMFFVNPDLSVYRIEFWFLDWFDGAHRVLHGKNYELMSEIYENFRECGSCAAELEKANEE